jgi:hypothetical protein
VKGVDCFIYLKRVTLGFHSFLHPYVYFEWMCPFSTMCYRIYAPDSAVYCKIYLIGLPVVWKILDKVK